MKKSTAARWLLMGLFALSALAASAQRLDHIQGEVLLQLRDGVDMRTLTGQLQIFSQQPTRFRVRKRLAGPMNIWACTFDFAAVHEKHFLEAIRRHPLVRNAQLNHLVSPRSKVPNDPQFPKQWQYVNTGQSGGQPGADLDMELAWDITTGGLTPAGDTIVVCVIDEGLDLAHEDFGNNRWVNRGEIPNNGQDDDGNGFTDDYRGWNTRLNNDNIDVDKGHGTPVAGIIGAKGNNGVGVSGLNWNVKIMVVAGGIGLESEALEAYSYPLAHRRRYNTTNGREGAFVVATNASWGVDFGRPEEFPLWCSLYDSLGSAGILNVAATTNNDVDVDAQGDIPSNCASEFLISVTTTDDSGRRFRPAGYGPQSVDLASFGHEAWTTAKGNRYAAFSNTSAAAPHVAGTIALIYAAPCPSLIAIAQYDPLAAARLARNYILDGVTPEPSLQGITLTGGRLNINKSLRLLVDNCEDCPPPTGLKALSVTDTEARLSWAANDSIRKIDLRWRTAGGDDWQVVRNALSPFHLTGLTPCTTYEFQLLAYCSSETLDFGPPFTFTTDGCCKAPDRFRLTASNERSAAFQWLPVLAAAEYGLRIRKTGAPDWNEITTSRTFHVFNNLQACSSYEVQIQAVCQDGPSGYSPSLAFRTLGCGACLDKRYCTPEFIDASAEWIADVELNTLENSSGPDNGYGDYTGQPATELVIGQSYPIRLRAGYAGQEQFEYFQVWIDLNQDGSFADNERVYDPGGVIRKETKGTISIPSNTLPGITRMRVAMSFFRPGGPCLFPDNGFGEVEDYCVIISTRASPSCPPPSSVETALIGNTRVDLRWAPVPSATYLLRYRKRNGGDWKNLSSVTAVTRIQGLSPCADYEAQVKALCNGIPGLFSPSLSFRTDCSTATGTPAPILNLLSAFPNPFADEVALRLSLRQPQRQLRISLFDAAGRMAREWERELPSGVHNIRLDVDELPSGVYWLRILPGKSDPVVCRLIKVTR